MKLKSLMNDFIQNYLDENAIKFEDWNISTNNQDGFGDYSSNIALKLTKQLKQSPISIAESIVDHNNPFSDTFTLSASILDLLISI